jgi:hypothetical protein
MEQPTFPWSEDSPIKGNLAIGNLRENLKRLLTDTRGIHVETLLTAIGSIAGFAAQNAFWAKTHLTPASVPETGLGSQLVVVRLKTGERLFFGDGINSYLAGGVGPAERLFLWSFVQGALVQLGLPLNQQPDVRMMFSRVSKTVGAEEFGFPDVPSSHRPRSSAVTLVRLLWPHTQAILKLKPPPGVATSEDDLDESYWPFVSFIVASQLLMFTRDHVPPGVAATLVMESAIAASKLDLSTTTESQRVS